MARPKKQGLDYFPLDTTFDEKVQALETLFGNDGLVWIIKFWQSAYRSDNGQVNLSKYFGEIHAKNCRLTIEKQAEIIKFCLDVPLIEKINEGIYSSSGIRKRISAVSKQRSDAIKRYFKGKKIKDKVKESKVKDFGSTSPKYNSFDEYKNEELIEYSKLMENQIWIKEQQKYNPNLNILLSLEKAHTQFWGTEAGWEFTKKKKSKTKNWKRTYENALSLKTNQVWLPKDQQPKPETPHPYERR